MRAAIVLVALFAFFGTVVSQCQQGLLLAKGLDGERLGYLNGVAGFVDKASAQLFELCPSAKTIEVLNVGPDAPYYWALERGAGASIPYAYIHDVDSEKVSIFNYDSDTYRVTMENTSPLAVVFYNNQIHGSDNIATLLQSEPAAYEVTLTFLPVDCDAFPENNFGAPLPVVEARSTANGVEVKVKMQRNSINNNITPVFHMIEAGTPSGNTVCQTAQGAIASWTSAEDSCTTTYTMTQTYEEMYNSNNWIITSSTDGRTLSYSLPIRAIYSVVRGDRCHYTAYDKTVTTSITLAVETYGSDSPSLIAADNAAKMLFTSLMMSTSSTLEMKIDIVPLIPGSLVTNFALAKQGGGQPFTVAPATNTQVDYVTYKTSGYPFTFTATSLTAGTSLTGSYDLTMDVVEGSESRSTKIEFSLTYIVPQPTVISGDTISVGSVLYTSQDYTDERTSSYRKSQVLYIEHKKTNGPTIPSTYSLALSEAYLCCVAYGNVIPPYDPQTSSGCKFANGRVGGWEKRTELKLPAGAAQNGASVSAAVPARNDAYRMQIDLSRTFTSTIAAPLTCEVLIISKFDAGQARRIGEVNLNGTFHSSSSIKVETVDTIAVSSASTISSLIAVVVALIVLVF